MNKGLRILGWTAMGLLAVSVFGLVTMLLWNWLVPVLFNGPIIGFWQALGLLVLSKLLFWGAGGKGNHWRSRGYQNHWKNKVYNKFSSMTPEEREALKQKMKEKWCHWEESGSSKDSSTSNDWRRGSVKNRLKSDKKIERWPDLFVQGNCGNFCNVESFLSFAALC